MNNNGVIFICFLCLFLLLCGVVSASDANCTNDNVTSISNDEILSVDDSIDVINDNHACDEILSDSNVGTFTELNNTIYSSKTGIVKLTKDYAYTSGVDDAFSIGIYLNSSVVSINGLNHIISGSNQARIFNVNGSGIVLKDIKFTNGFYDSNPGGTYGAVGVINGVSNVQILRCSFDSCSSVHDPALVVYGTDCEVKDCIFTNNVATSGNAGAMSVETAGTSCRVMGCIFEGNRAGNQAGAIKIKSENSIVSYCTFNNNHAKDYGVFDAAAKYVTISHCNFNNNYATNQIGVIRLSDQYCIIEDCTFDRNYASSYSVVSLAAYYCRLKNSTFTNNYASVTSGSRYGAVFMNQACYVLDCTFINNTAPYGGAIYSNVDSNSIENSYFYNNTAYTSGGAIYLPDKVVKIVNCVFKGNTAGNGGGAVTTGAGIFDSVFENNNAGTTGGAVRFLSGSYNCMVTTSTFKNNVAGTDGGAISSADEAAVISECNFIENSANNGGAVSSTENNYLVVRHSQFRGNVAAELGGGIYSTKDYFTELNCTFTDNSAKYNSSAMYVLSGGHTGLQYTDPGYVNYTKNTGTEELMPLEITITTTNGITLKNAINTVANGGTIHIKSGRYVQTACLTTASKTFNIIGETGVILDYGNTNFGNNANGGLRVMGSLTVVRDITFTGGGSGSYVIYGNGAQFVTFLNCTFDKTRSFRPGGRYWTVENCTFSNNDLISYDQSSGSAYRVGTVKGCTFVNNTAQAVYINVPSIDVFDCVFINNTNTTKTGMAITITGGGFLSNVTGCTFVNNTSSAGGALHSSCEELYISDCYFDGNNAVNNGGAILLSGNGNIIINSTFIDNRAVNGGGIYSTGQHYNFTDLTFRENTASNSGGGLYTSDSDNVLSDCGFYDNSALSGGAFYSGGSDVSVSGSDFINNTATYGGAFYSGGSDAAVEGSNFIDNSANNGSAIMLGVDSNIHIVTTYFENNVGLNNTVYLDYSSLLVVDISSTNLPKIDTRGPGTYNPTMKLIYVDNYDSYIREGTLENPTSLIDALVRVSDNGEIRILNGTYTIQGMIEIKDKSFNITGWNNSNVVISNPMFNIYSPDVRLINLHFVDVDEEIVWSESGGLIKSCSFDGTNTNMNSAYISVDGESFSVVDSNFTGFRYHSIIFTSLDSVLIDNCIFDSNLAVNISSDYVLDLEGAETSILNTNFTNNNVRLIKLGSSLSYSNIIKNSVFNNNSVGLTDGALILINTFNSELLNSSFTSNVAGSVVRVNGTGFSFSECLFKDNVGLYGGAIHLTKDVVVINSTFLNNSAVNGSAIYYSGDSRLGVVDCTFAVPKFDENNNVVEGYIYSNIDVNLTRITFSFTDLYHVINSANDTLDLKFNYMYFSDYDYNLIKGVLINKSLTIDGNGHVLDGCGESRILLIKSSDSSDFVSLYNLTFVNGKGQYGYYVSWYSGQDVVAGAISNFNPIHVENCTFINNTARWGGAIYNGGGATIVECIFTNNSAVDGGNGGAIGTTMPLNVTYSTFNYNPSNSTSGRDSCIYVTSGGTGVYINYNVFACATAIYKNYDLEVEDISNNWWGSNDPTFTYLSDSDPLQARLNFVSVTKVGNDYVYVFNVTFHNGAGDLIPVPWVRTVNYTVTDLNSVIGEVVGLTTNTSWLSNKVLWNLSAMVDNQNLTPYLYPYLALQCLIDYSNANSTLNLCHDYTYSPVVDANNLPNGIVIDKKIIIEGNEHCIDGVSNGTCRAFYITANDVVINNLTIKNSIQLGDNAGAILWTGSNGVIINSTLKNNGDGTLGRCRGGAIYWSGNNATIYNCEFTGNNVGLGGAVYWSGSEGIISYCRFNNNNAINGGAVYCDCDDIIIIYSDFRDNAAVNGGAVYSANNVTVISSDFTNNSADYGGAIYLLDGYSTILDTTFEDNRAINGSAIYIVTSVNHWYNLDFIENIATTNATVYFREDSTVYSDNLTFTGNVIPNGLHIVGETHIYSPRIYVNQTHPGFGIIMSEPTSLTRAVDNILDNGIIIICSDYTLEAIIKLNNLTNVTVTGNHTLRKDKYQFIIPMN